MPPATTGAGPFIDPPWARKPLRVRNSRLVSNSQTTRPSLLEWARTAPSLDGENTMPGIAVTAENSAPLHARLSLPQTGSGGAAYHARAPVASSTACSPPGVLAVDLGDRNVDALAIGGDAPLDAAEPAATAGAIAPDLLALAVGIERVDDARLLSGDDQLAPVRQLRQNRRRAEVEVGSGALAAVHLAGRAAEHVGRGRCHLPRPSHRAVLRDRRPARRRWSAAPCRCTCSNPDIERAAPGVDRRRRPDRTARRPAHFRPVRILRGATAARQESCSSSR